MRHLTPVQRIVLLHFARSRRELTVRQVSEALNRDRAWILELFQSLHQKGLVLATKGKRYRRWSITIEGYALAEEGGHLEPE